jgi:type I restriction enzyme S subunit
VTLPPIETQRAIAYILGMLDEKIELNRYMNETLEAMACATFKSWFLDFDPVHTKAEARQPYRMDAATAALFPDSFDDSPLGKIPSGWKVDEIRTRASDIQYGLTRSAATDPIGPRFLRITDIQGGRVDWSRVPFCPVSDEEHQKYRICPGDILVARTGASTGENIYIIDAPDAVFASYLVRIQFADLSFARVVGEYMRSVAYFDHVAGAIGGSAQPNASAQVLASAPLAFPPIAVARTFLQLVDPLDRQRLLNSRQSQTLVSIRNALLPKLISGQIRIHNAERLVEASK